jgi:hypothetical protein
MKTKQKRRRNKMLELKKVQARQSRRKLMKEEWRGSHVTMFSRDREERRARVRKEKGKEIAMGWG